MAMIHFENDQDLLRTLLIDLGEACLEVGKNTAIKNYAVNSHFPKYELLPILRGINSFTTFNTWWKPKTRLEKALYSLDPQIKIKGKDSAELLKKAKRLLLGVA